MTRVLWAALTVVAVGLAAVLLAGWRPVALVSGSMAPTAPAGSLLLARPVPAEEVAVGDVITVPLGERGRVTHRVVALEQLEGTTYARLRGDANQAPDPGRVPLVGGVLRTVVVVPVLGRLVAGTNPLLVAGLGLLVIGSTGLALVGRRGEAAARDDREVAEGAAAGPTPPVRLPAGRTGVDTRVLALAATLEAFAEDGMDHEDLVALARARTGALLGAVPVEDSDPARGLDDGARFVLLAYADADADALRIVPTSSARAVTARAVVAAWWEQDVGRVPATVRSQLHDVLTAAAAPFAQEVAS